MPSKEEKVIALTDEQRTIVTIQNLYRENEKLKAENKRLSSAAEAEGLKDALLGEMCRKIAFARLAGYGVNSKAKKAESYEGFAKSICFGDFDFWDSDEAREIAKGIAFNAFVAYFDAELRAFYEEAKAEAKGE